MGVTNLNPEGELVEQKRINGCTDKHDTLIYIMLKPKNIV